MSRVPMLAMTLPLRPSLRWCLSTKLNIPAVPSRSKAAPGLVMISMLVAEREARKEPDRRR